MIRTIVEVFLIGLGSIALALMMGFMLGVGFTSGVTHAVRNYANEINTVHVSKP